MKHPSSSKNSEENLDETLDLWSNKPKNEVQAISYSDEPDADDHVDVLVFDREPPR